MKYLHFQRLVAPLAVAVTFGLAGCGGSSNTMEEPPAEEMAKVCTDAGGRVEADGSCTSAEMLMAERAKMQADALKMAAAEVTMALENLGGTPDQSAIDAAGMKVAALKAALDAAADVSDDLKVGFMATHASASASIMAAQAARDDADDTAEMMATKAMDAHAKALLAGTATTNGLGTTAPSDDSTLGFAHGSHQNADTSLSPPRLTLFNDNDFELTVTDAADGNIVTATNPVNYRMHLEPTDEMVPDLAGWKGTKYVRTSTDGSRTDTAVVYTNRQIEQKLFTAVHAATDATVPGTGFLADIPATHRDETEVMGVLNNADTGVNGGTGLRFGVIYPVTGTGFRTTPGVKEHEVGDNQKWVAIRGTLQGAPGEFRCNATCYSIGTAGGGTVLTDSTNPTTQSAANWVFVPDANAMASVPELDFVGFGWWAREEGEVRRGDGFHFISRTNYAEGGFYPGSVISAAADITDVARLTGTATYTGAAAGQVAFRNPLAPSRTVGGSFTADATLTADFGTAGDTITTAAVGGSLKGTIDNFMVNGHAMDDWMVKLNSATITGFANTGVEASGMTEWHIGDNKGPGDGGGWNGYLVEQDADSKVPLTAVGQFDAKYGPDGRMSGGFGATTSE